MAFLRNQLLIWQVTRVNESKQRIAEQVRVLAIIESPLELVQIGIHMLRADLVKRSNNRTIEEGPRAFDIVGMGFSAHPLFGGVIHRIVLMGLLARLVGRVFVREDRGVWSYALSAGVTNM